LYLSNNAYINGPNALANYRKIHYNVMRFRDTVSVDEAEVLAGRFKSVSARYYVLDDPEKLTDKYITAWMNFGIGISNIAATL
jgi:hypothetical protein